MEIILFVAGVIGLTHIVVDGKIFLAVREFVRRRLPVWMFSLLTCYQCSGFWAGLFCGWLAFPKASAWQILTAGFAGSFLATLGAACLNYLEARTLVSLGDDEEGRN